MSNVKYNHIMLNCQNCGLQTVKTYAFNAKEFKNNVAKQTKGSILVCRKCKNFYKERKDKLKLVLDSGANKRLIVSGPGTGKTFAFKRIVSEMSPNAKVCIFTLINNLANDLIEEFDKPEFENVKASTFHGYCKQLLYSKLGFGGKYYPNLSALIKDDSDVLGFGYTEKNFQIVFANLKENDSILKFFIDRSTYYNAVSHQDSVYKVYKIFSENSNSIPRYDLVIADEYQDFNKLEVSFINLLSSKSSILIAGDDDQSLYGFREASKEHIINLYNSLPENQRFNLPFSSRCTEVLMDSVNSLIEKAVDTGLLGNRISDKEYVSYWPDKYALDTKYAQIVVAQCTIEKTAFQFIKHRIETITRNEGLTGREQDIQFLVIGAESQHRLNSLADFLEQNLDTDLYTIEKKEASNSNEIEEGYDLVRFNEKSNLGWRIILHEDPAENISEIIHRSYKEKFPIYDLLPNDYKNEHTAKIKEFFSKKKNILEEVINENFNKIRIKLTNYLGSKGLSALHVVIWELHNGVLPSDLHNISDEDIYRFIVALTRAKRSCSTVSFKEYDRVSKRLLAKKSILLDYLPQRNLKIIKCRLEKGNLIYRN